MRRKHRRGELPDFLRASSLGMIIFVDRIVFLSCLYLICSFSGPEEAYIRVLGLTLSLPAIFMALNVLWALLILIEAVGYLRSGCSRLHVLAYSGLPLVVVIASQAALYRMAFTAI